VKTYKILKMKKDAYIRKKYYTFAHHIKKNELLKIAVRLIQDIERADATLFL